MTGRTEKRRKEKKQTKRFFNFTKIEFSLRLETKDTTFFTNPYGPEYSDAVGKIYERIPGGSGGPDPGMNTLGFVKSITPNLPERWWYPIKVSKQKVNKEGNLVLFAEIRHSKTWTLEIIDRHKTDGKKIEIELYGDSVGITLMPRF